MTDMPLWTRQPLTQVVIWRGLCTVDLGTVRPNRDRIRIGTHSICTGRCNPVPHPLIVDINNVDDNTRGPSDISGTPVCHSTSKGACVLLVSDLHIEFFTHNVIDVSVTV